MEKLCQNQNKKVQKFEVLGSNLSLKKLEKKNCVEIETKDSLKQEEPTNISNNLNKNISFCEMHLHKEGHLLNRQEFIYF